MSATRVAALLTSRAERQRPGDAPRVKQFTPPPSLSALRTGRRPDDTMTWLEILLVVAVLLIALGLTRRS